MIRTADEAVSAVGAINRMGLGARPDYAEFVRACEAAVADGCLVERRDHPAARREFWIEELAPVPARPN